LNSLRGSLAEEEKVDPSEHYHDLQVCPHLSSPTIHSLRGSTEVKDLIIAQKIDSNCKRHNTVETNLTNKVCY